MHRRFAGAAISISVLNRDQTLPIQSDFSLELEDVENRARIVEELGHEHMNGLREPSVGPRHVAGFTTDGRISEARQCAGHAIRNDTLTSVVDTNVDIDEIDSIFSDDKADWDAQLNLNNQRRTPAWAVAYHLAC